MTEISRTQERPVILGEYIIEHKATVRQTAREFGISKSTVHMGVTNWNGLGRISSGGRWGRAVGLLGNILLCGVKLFSILYNEKSDSGSRFFVWVCFQTVRDRLYAKRKFVHSSA